MYLNYGLELKYPKANEGSDNPSMVGRSAEEIREQRDALRKQFGENIEGL